MRTTPQPTTNTTMPSARPTGASAVRSVRSARIRSAAWATSPAALAKTKLVPRSPTTSAVWSRTGQGASPPEGVHGNTAGMKVAT